LEFFEVGLGGRFDATNVLNPRIVILTPISLDHETILGNSIAQIAREKAAVIPQGADVVVGEQPQEAFREISRKTHQMNGNLWEVGNHFKWRLGLKGDFQKRNAAAAIRAAGLLGQREELSFSASEIQRGLLKQNWPGRFERASRHPEIILDAAHNLASVEALVKNLKQSYPQKDAILVFGTSRDKKAGAMLKLLSSYFSKVVLAPIPNPRSYEIESLLFEARNRFGRVFATGSVGEALGLATKLASPKSLIVGTGSFYLIGAMRQLLRKRKGSLVRAHA